MAVLALCGTALHVRRRHSMERALIDNSSSGVSALSSVIGRRKMVSVHQGSDFRLDSCVDGAPPASPPEAPMSPFVPSQSLVIIPSSNLEETSPATNLDASSSMLAERGSDHNSDQEVGAQILLAAAPRSRGRPLAPESLPLPPLQPPTSPSDMSILRNQLAQLQEEVARIRAGQEMHH